MQAKESVEDAVRSAIAATCQVNVEDVRSEVSIEDLGLGSMGLVAVMARVEAIYDLEFSSDENVSLLQARAVGEFSALVRKMIEAKEREEGSDLTARA